MSTTEDDTLFAFGNDWVDDNEGVAQSCPALSAGLSPSAGNGTTVAESYDEVVRSMVESDYHEGVVDEATAREAWSRVLDEAAEEESPYRGDAIYVAEELGWT